MECRVDDVVIHYAEHGRGEPLVALHGAGVDHREIEAAVEALALPAGLRRIYPDLPGMGCTTAGGLADNDAVVALLARFLDHLDAGPVLLLGHSYGGYLARGIAGQRPDLVRGLALVAPIGDGSGDVPAASVVRDDPGAADELDDALRAGFDDYFVVRTRATARRYRDHVAPGTTLVDEATLGRIFAGWTIDLGPAGFDAPTLIVAGRRDSTVGYADAVQLVERYPQATLAVVDDAGHALMHEQPELLAALVRDWVRRCASRPSGSPPVAGSAGDRATPAAGRPAPDG